MIAKDQFKMIFRHWGRNRLNTFISFASLVIGLTCSLMLMLFVMNEYRIATALKKAKDVCLVRTVEKVNDADTKPGSWVEPGQVWAITDKMPAAGSFCLLYTPHQGKIKIDDRETDFWDGVYETGPGFADYFGLPVLRGDLKKTLSASNEAAITASYARILLGDKEPIGTKIVFRKAKYVQMGLEYAEFEKYITCVIDDSQRSALDIRLLFGTSETELFAFRDQRWSGLYTGFVRLQPGADYRDVERQIDADSTILRVGNNITSVELVPIDKVYFMDRSDDHNQLLSSRDPQLLYIGGFTSLLILLIACFNYVNLTMTCAAERLRNVAGQRILGASKWNVRWQVVLETLLHVAICSALALGLIYLLLPDFNGFLACDIHFGDLLLPDTIGVGMLLLLCVTLLPSAYILSRLETDSLLVFLKKGSGRKSYLVQGMVIGQFAISTVLIVVCLNVFRQIDYITQVRPMSGQLLNVQIPVNSLTEEEKGTVQTFMDRIRNLPSVEGMWNSNMYYSSIWSVGTEEGKTKCRLIDAEPGYFEFFGIRLLAGRGFSPGEAPDRIVINEATARVFKKEDPIGTQIEFAGDKFTVVGLVADLPENLHEPAVPTIYRPTKFGNPEAFTVKAVEGQTRKAQEDIMALWKDIYKQEGEKPWTATAAEFYKMQHNNDVRVSKMVLTFTAISLLLTVMGLFGLAWYSVERRRREIALRKVHGATTGEVVGMLCGGFLRWIALSFVIAIPFAYYFSALWFRGFAYKTNLSVWVFVTTALFVGLVGMLTVLWQSWRAARRNPVNSIKAE